MEKAGTYESIYVEMKISVQSTKSELELQRWKPKHNSIKHQSWLPYHMSVYIYL